MDITRNSEGRFTVDGNDVGTLEDCRKAVVEATQALSEAQAALTNVQAIEDAVSHFPTPAQ